MISPQLRIVAGRSTSHPFIPHIHLSAYSVLDSQKEQSFKKSKTQKFYMFGWIAVGG
jgi:hypothetical protein